jgi:glucose uptake protein
MKEYFTGSMKTHLTGVLGGFIWMIGMVVSFMAAGASNPAISYALSNAAPVVAIIWGVFIWKEFKDAPGEPIHCLQSCFCCFLWDWFSLQCPTLK